MSSSLQKNEDGNEEEFRETMSTTTTTTEQHEKEGRRRQQKHHPLYHGTNLAPKALIFDCDGTILETMTLFFVADKQTCEEYGLELTKKRFYELAGVPIKEIFRILRDEQGKTEEEITEEDLDRMTYVIRSKSSSVISSSVFPCSSLNILKISFIGTPASS